MLSRDRTPSDACPFRRAKLVIRHAPAAVDPVARQRVHEITVAHWQLDRATEAYADACKALGEANRRLSPKHRGAGVWPLHLRRLWVREAFRQINRTRAALRAARKALAALEAA